MSWIQMFDFDIPIETRTRALVNSLPIQITDRFPIEIIDHIIQHLLHNLVSLLKCGLVCKSWLALSRPYIFRDVNLSRRDKMAAFMQLVESPLSTIRSSWITSVSLAHRYKMVGSQNLESPGGFIPNFPSVRTLRVAIRSSASDHLDVFLPHFTLFPHLTSLTLRNPVFRSTVELAQALHHLQCLQEVNLIDVRCRSGAPNSEYHESLELYEASQPLYPLPPGVVQFRILGCSHSGYILRWLDEQGPALPPIKVLAYELDWGMLDHVDRISWILDTLGPALHHVTLEADIIDFGGTEDLSGECLNILSQNTELRSLTILNLEDIAYLAGCFEAFSHLTSRHLERIEFHFATPPPPSAFADPASVVPRDLDILRDSPSWAKLREALLRCPALSNVREMYFWVPKYTKTHEAVIRRELSAHVHTVHVLQSSNGPQTIAQRWRPAYSAPWRRRRGLI